MPYPGVEFLLHPTPALLYRFENQIPTVFHGLQTSIMPFGVML